MALKELVHVASSLNSIIDFIEGASFLEALSAIGDNELQAAKLAMQNAGKANDRKREVTLAIGHLQSAHTAYRSVWKQAYGSDFSKRTKAISLELAAKKDCYISCLMALCYVYLREFQLARNSVTFAKEADHAKSWFDRQPSGGQAVVIIGTMLREPGKLIEGFKGDIPFVDVKDFSKEIGVGIIQVGQTRISAQDFLAGSMCTYPGFTVPLLHRFRVTECE